VVAKAHHRAIRLFQIFAATAVAIVLFGGLISQTGAVPCGYEECITVEAPGSVNPPPGPTDWAGGGTQPIETGYVYTDDFKSPALRHFTQSLAVMSTAQLQAAEAYYFGTASKLGPDSPLYDYWMFRSMLVTDALYAMGCEGSISSGWVCLEPLQ
jgi:hypothetical protein